MFEPHLLHCPADLAILPALRMFEHPVDRLDHRNRRTERTCKSRQLQPRPVKAGIGVTAIQHPEQFRVAVPPLIDRLLDVAHIEEGTEPLLLRLEHFVGEIRNRSPLLIGCILKFVKQIMIVNGVQSLLQHHTVGKRKRKRSGLLRRTKQKNNIFKCQLSIPADRSTILLIETPDQTVAGGILIRDPPVLHGKQMPHDPLRGTEIAAFQDDRLPVIME